MKTFPFEIGLGKFIAVCLSIVFCVGRTVAATPYSPPPLLTIHGCCMDASGIGSPTDIRHVFENYGVPAFAFSENNPDSEGMDSWGNEIMGTISLQFSSLYYYPVLNPDGTLGETHTTDIAFGSQPGFSNQFQYLGSLYNGVGGNLGGFNIYSYPGKLKIVTASEGGVAIRSGLVGFGENEFISNSSFGPKDYGTYFNNVDSLITTQAVHLGTGGAAILDDPEDFQIRMVAYTGEYQAISAGILANLPALAIACIFDPGQCQNLINKAGAYDTAYNLFNLTVARLSLFEAATFEVRSQGQGDIKGQPVTEQAEPYSEFLTNLFNQNINDFSKIRIATIATHGNITPSLGWTVNLLTQNGDDGLSDPNTAINYLNSLVEDGDVLVVPESAHGQGIPSLDNPNVTKYDVNIVDNSVNPTNPFSFPGGGPDGGLMWLADTHNPAANNRTSISFEEAFLDPANSVSIQEIQGRSADFGKTFLVNSAQDITACGTIEDYILRNYSTMGSQGRNNLPLAVLPSVGVTNNLDPSFSFSNTFGIEAFSNFRANPTGDEEQGDFINGGIGLEPGDNNLQIFSKNIANLTSVDYSTIRTPQISSPLNGGGFTQGANSILGYAYAVSPATFVSYGLDEAPNVTQQLFPDSSPPAASPNQIIVSLLTPDGSGALPNATSLIKTQVFFVDAPAGATGPGALNWHVRFQSANASVQQPISFSYSATNTLTGQTVSGGPFTLNSFQPIPVNNSVGNNPYLSETEVPGTSPGLLGTWNSLAPLATSDNFRLRLTVSRTEGGVPEVFTHVVDNIFVFGPNTPYPFVSMQLFGIPGNLPNLVQNPVSANNSSQVVFEGYDDAGPGIDHYEAALIDTGQAKIPNAPFQSVPENISTFIAQEVQPVLSSASYQTLGNTSTNEANGIMLNLSDPFNIPDLCSLQAPRVFAVVYTAVDKAGNSSQTGITVLQYTPSDNTVPPFTSNLQTSGPFVPAGTNSYYSNPIDQFTLTASEPQVCGKLSGIQAINLSINGVNQVFISSPPSNTFSINFQVPNEGLNSLEYYAVDAKGNSEQPHFVSLLVDGTAPNSSLPLNGVRYGSPQCIPTQPGLAGYPLVITSGTPLTLQGFDPLMPTPVGSSSVASGISRFLFRFTPLEPSPQLGSAQVVLTSTAQGLSATSQPIYVPGGVDGSSVLGDDGDYLVEWSAVDQVDNVEAKPAVDRVMQIPNTTTAAAVQSVRSQSSFANYDVITIDNTPPNLVFLSPSPNNVGVCRVVNGVVKIIGSFTDTHFQDYSVEYASGLSPTASSFVQITSVAGVEVPAGWLATWDTRSLVSGFYTLELNGTDCVQNADSITTTVYVGPHPAETLQIGGSPHKKPVFNSPVHVAVYNPLTNSANCAEIFVTDENANEVKVFDSNGDLLTHFGRRSGNNKGQGHGADSDKGFDQGLGDKDEGELKHPSGIAIDNSSEEIFVADSQRSRILVFDLTGRFKREFGRKGSGQAEFDRPMGLAIDAAGNLWVADENNDRVEKVDPSGNYLQEIVGFDKPEDVSVDSFAGEIHVADTGHGAIKRFKPDGTLDLVLNIDGGGGTGKEHGQNKGRDDKGMGRPSGVLGNALGYIYVTDPIKSQIIKFDRFGNRILNWGTEGKGSFEYDKLSGLTEDNQGNLYLADSGNRRVFRFSLPGTTFSGPQGCVLTASKNLDQPPVWIQSIGLQGSGSGQFNHPQGAVIDSQGDIWIADTGNNRVQELDSQGNTLLVVGEAGTRNGEFYEPEGVALDQSGNILVSDTGNNRLQTLGRDGTFLSSVNVGGIMPSAAVQQVDGTYLIADPDKGEVLKFSASGVAKGLFVDLRTAQSREKSTLVMAQDSQGQIYLGNNGRKGIQIFDSQGSSLGNILPEPGQAELGAGGLAVDSDNNLFVTANQSNLVYKFDKQGTERYSFGQFGMGNGDFDQPQGIAEDANSNLWVVDSGNSRIEEFGVMPGTLSSTANAGALDLEGLDATPNPFNPAGGVTSITYNMTLAANVSLVISDGFGRTVYTASYSSGSQGGLAGANMITWSGRNLSGSLVPFGNYIVNVTASEGSESVTRTLSLGVSNSPGVNGSGSSTGSSTSFSLSGLSINPNPADHRHPATITYDLSSNASVSVVVTDKLGNVYFSFTGISGGSGGTSGNNSVVMTLGGPPGLSPYTLKVTANNGSALATQTLTFITTP